MHHERVKVINHAGDRPSNTHLPGYKDFKSNYMCVQKTRCRLQTPRYTVNKSSHMLALKIHPRLLAAAPFPTAKTKWKTAHQKWKD